MLLESRTRYFKIDISGLNVTIESGNRKGKKKGKVEEKKFDSEEEAKEFLNEQVEKKENKGFGENGFSLVFFFPVFFLKFCVANS